MVLLSHSPSGINARSLRMDIHQMGQRNRPFAPKHWTSFLSPFDVIIVKQGNENGTFQPLTISLLFVPNTNNSRQQWQKQRKWDKGTFRNCWKSARVPNEWISKQTICKFSNKWGRFTLIIQEKCIFAFVIVQHFTACRLFQWSRTFLLSHSPTRIISRSL